VRQDKRGKSSVCHVGSVFAVERLVPEVGMLALYIICQPQLERVTDVVDHSRKRKSSDAELDWVATACNDFSSF